ncbi:MAG: cytochrome b/b6 domain-containing protein [Comamonadaceae bacterium]
MKKVRIWDLPTRLFHWALVISFVGLIVTGKTGGNAINLHFKLGYAVASLLLFRIIWGLVGGRWSRFAAFIYRPRSLVAYLKGRAPVEHSVGHTPLAAGSVFAMLLFLLVQVITGLFSQDKGESFGPLNSLVSQNTARLVTAYHKNVGQVALLLLVGLHLLAIAVYYFRKKTNLVKPMLLGDKLLPEQVLPSVDNARSRAAAAILFVACVAAVTWIASLGD